MSEMIERVAQAVIAKNERLSWSEANELARAAIEAMREPTDEMKAAAPDMDDGMSPISYRQGDILNGYRQLIDAALK